MSLAAGEGSRPRKPPIDARTLVRWARRGGTLALSHFRRAEAEGKADSTIVTAADREIESFVRAEIEAHHPGVATLGEEFPPTGDALAGWTVAIDPIDGTDAYVAGLPTWSVSIGLLDRGVATAGVVYLPAFDDLYVAQGGVLKWNGEDVPRGGVEPQHSGFVLAYSEFHRRHLLGFGKGTRKMRALGSTAYHLSLVARGAAEAAILGRVHLWDIAAGVALLDAAGGELVYLRSGRPVELHALAGGGPARDLMVAARQGSMAKILRQIRAR